MIAAAIVCAAAFSQASTFTWGATKVYAQGTEAGISGVAYLFGGDFTTASIISALEGKGATAVNDWIGDLTAYKTAAVNGKLSDTTTKPDASKAGLASDGSTQTLFALIFNTDTVTDAAKFFVIATDKAVPESGNALFSFGAQGNSSLTGASQVAGAWHAVNVPEPTSGLLLLLGVAGMALRRRRA